MGKTKIYNRITNSHSNDIGVVVVVIVVLSTQTNFL